MDDEHRAETLHRALGQLESIRDAAGHIDWRKDRDYREALKLLSSAGVDVTPYMIRDEDYFPDPQGTTIANYYAFTSRLSGALSVTQREIDRAEREQRSLQTAPVGTPSDDAGPQNNVVFFVHGRDEDAKNAIRS